LQDSPPAGDADVATRVQATLDIPDDLERIRALAELLQSLPATAAPEIVSGYENAFIDRGDIELVLFVQWWAPHDPDAAHEWATSGPIAAHPRIENAVMRATARVNPQLATQMYYEKSRDPRNYGAVLEALIVGWYESGSPDLLDFVNKQPSLEVRQQAAGTLARMYVLDKGMEAATRWVEQVARNRGNDDLSTLLLYRVASAGAEYAPEFTAEWAKGLVDEGAQTRLMTRVAARWSMWEPTETIAWLEGFDPSPDRAFALRRSFTNFRQHHSAEADAWLDAQGDAAFGWLSPALEYQIKTQTDRSYAKESERSGIDWPGTLARAIRIEDPARRWGTVTHVARLWALEDTLAADTWLDANEVPENYKRKAHGPLPAGYQRKLERLADW